MIRHRSLEYGILDLAREGRAAHDTSGDGVCCYGARRKSACVYRVIGNSSRVYGARGEGSRRDGAARDGRNVHHGSAIRHGECAEHPLYGDTVNCAVEHDVVVVPLCPHSRQVAGVYTDQVEPRACEVQLIGQSVVARVNRCAGRDGSAIVIIPICRYGRDRGRHRLSTGRLRGEEVIHLVQYRAVPEPGHPTSPPLPTSGPPPATSEPLYATPSLKPPNTPSLTSVWAGDGE